MPRLRSNTAIMPAPVLAVVVLNLVSATAASAAINVSGQVVGSGAPIASSTVTLYAASAGAPKQLAQAKSGADGRFVVTAPDNASAGTSLYLIA